MEETSVLIVGAGPTGLALAVTLGLAGIQTVVLEKGTQVSEDPRGIALTGDAVRIAYQLGIGSALTSKIGQDIGLLHFHYLSFLNPSFMNFDMTLDTQEQSVSGAISQFQPNLELVLRAELERLPMTDLRLGCEVVDRVEDSESVTVAYQNSTGVLQKIHTKWFIGADGKTGIIRKRFLEPEGIKQVTGLYEYEATWVAANLQIKTPTPQSHPDFPLWKLGYTPAEVYEVFWPSGFHFCNDPRRPAVSGRFGQPGAKFWRHEFSVEATDCMDNPLQEFWKHFGPWMVRPGSHLRVNTTDPVEYPRDCIEVLRCRPFCFAAKVANRWFCRKTIIIGDAAHVFPPFGGQGIAAGVRDAHSLGWRIAMIERQKLPPAAQERILLGWNSEQRQRVDDSLRMTMVNGEIVNRRSAILAFLHRCTMRALWLIPGISGLLTYQAFGDHLRFDECANGCFILSKGGGRKLPQIWIREIGGSPQLSDNVFFRQRSKFALLVVNKRNEPIALNVISSLIADAGLLPEVLSIDSVTFLLDGPQQSQMEDGKKSEAAAYYACSAAELEAEGHTPIKGYDERSLTRRLGSSAKFVIVRPDFFVHSIAAEAAEFHQNAKGLLDLLL